MTVDGPGYFTVMDVLSRASATGTIVLSGTLQVQGSASGGVVGAGGHLYVDSSGTDFADTVGSGGKEAVDPGGVLSGATVLSGGLLDVAGTATGELRCKAAAASPSAATSAATAPSAPLPAPRW